MHRNVFGRYVTQRRCSDGNAMSNLSYSNSFVITFCFVAIAHQCAFPYSTFQINDNSRENSLFKNFLLMLDMGDVRDDFSEHFGVVGDRIVGSFRSQPSYLRYTESDCLINPSQVASSTQVATVTRQKDRQNSYGAVKSSAEAIGRNTKNYRVAKIEERQSPDEHYQRQQNSSSTTSTMTQSTTSTRSSFGINVTREQHENNLINYRNPDT